ncbi:MAG: SRPBCC family protein [Gemmatimonadetes bacterium]|nr:SRPBCC family protein [Gemmatimonadota bacterium]
MNPDSERGKQARGRTVVIHERYLPSRPDEAGALIDSLASPKDRLWPRDAWPSMRLDSGLRVGSAGGHGPIRYSVEAYDPARLVRFRFTAPRGFGGTHEFEVIPTGEHATLRHVIDMRVSGLARLSWPAIYAPLHDALIEDALDRAESTLGVGAGRRSPWSPRVRALRRVLGGPGLRRTR